MAKILEIIGLVLVAIMTLGFCWNITTNGLKNGLSELFWGCAGATLMIIIYRKMKKNKKEEQKES